MDIKDIFNWFRYGILGHRKIHEMHSIYNQKVFCIGLHKTGTSTLAAFARQLGFREIHSTDWIRDEKKLKYYNFFSDGGSHFDNQNEFDYEGLYKRYPKSLFILQTRDTKSWIVSKLKHAGWHSNTVIQTNNVAMLNHDHWRYKSLLTIDKFIQHKKNYEKKIVNFFRHNDMSRLIVLDLTNRQIQENEFRRLTNYFGLPANYKIKIPHVNKSKSNDSLSDEVMVYIQEILR